MGAFGVRSTNSVDWHPGANPRDRPFYVYWHFRGTLQLKQNQNYNRLELGIGNRESGIGNRELGIGFSDLRLTNNSSIQFSFQECTL